MSKTIDFDAFRSERAHETISLVVGGKTYTLPGSLPAALALDVVRINAAQEKGEEVKTEDLVDIGAAIFGGAEQFREVLTIGRVTMDDFGDFIKLILEAYTAEVAPPNPTTQA